MEDDINKAFDLNGDGTIGPRDGLKLVAPIASVDGDDQLTIELIAQGRATGYYGEARGVMEGGSGRYRIYKCAYVVKGGALNPADEKPSGSRGFVDISKGATDWAVGDPWEMPPGSESWGNDITVLSRRWLPTPGQDWDLEVGNEPCDVNADGLQDCMREYGGVRIHGRYSNGILLDGDFEQFGLRMRGDLGTGIWFDQDGPRGLSTQIRWRYEDGSGDRYFRQVVDRSTGTLQMGAAGPGGGDFSVNPNGTIAVRASGTGNTGLFINNDDFDRNQEPDGDGIVVSQPAGATGRHLAITEGGNVTRFQVTGPSSAAGGRVYLGAQMGLRFEGAAEDDNATDVGAEDPSAPRTITFPDASGKVVTAQGSESHGPAMWGVSTGQDRLFDTGDEVCGAAGLACAETFDLGSSGSMPCDAAHGSRFLAFCR